MVEQALYKGPVIGSTPIGTITFHRSIQTRSNPSAIDRNHNAMAHVARYASLRSADQDKLTPCKTGILRRWNSIYYHGKQYAQMARRD